MKTKEIALVVPTIRENCIVDFIERWSSIGLFDHVDLILMEDNPTKTFKLPPAASLHISWDDITEALGKDEWIIPRRSDTVRSFAYLKAYHLGYKFIMTLDDDCYPCTEADGVVYTGEGFVAEHVRSLTMRTRWTNTLNSVTPRGIPYFNKGVNTFVMINHGLWTNVLDYDAPRQLVSPELEKFAFDSRIIPHGSYYPMCGMNVMWRREATVLMYHLLMGHSVSQPGGAAYKLPFDRFGDIWCGILSKKVLDLTGNNVSSGMPYIRHERASNPFTNLKKEANGLEVNEDFWEYVDSFNPSYGVAGPEHFQIIYANLGKHISAYRKFPEHREYFSELGHAMVIWSGLFGDSK